MSKPQNPSEPLSSNAESLQQAINETIELIPPRDDWAVQANEEIDRLHHCLPGAFVEIRHIGSTAVAGLIAKDSIDLIAGLSDWTRVQQVLDELQRCGYSFDAEANRAITGRRWLFRHRQGHRSHHLHLVEMNSGQWHDRVQFCEMLKRDSNLREQYAALKKALATRHADNRTAYSDAKTDFILAALVQERQHGQTMPPLHGRGPDSI